MSLPDPGTTPVSATVGWESIVGAIGPKVREDRQRLGLSLQQLAGRAEVSAAAIHKVERGDMVPTVTTLLKLAAALGRPIAHFVDDSGHAAPAAVHVRAEQRPAAPSDWAPAATGVTATGLTLRDDRLRGTAVHAVVEPGGASGELRAPRRGEELLLVLEGELAVTVAGEPYLVRAGDTLQYPAERPRSWRNPGTAAAHAVWWLLDD